MRVSYNMFCDAIRTLSEREESWIVCNICDKYLLVSNEEKKSRAYHCPSKIFNLKCKSTFSEKDGFKIFINTDSLKNHLPEEIYKNFITKIIDRKLTEK